MKKSENIVLYIYLYTMSNVLPSCKSKSPPGFPSDWKTSFLLFFSADLLAMN